MTPEEATRLYRDTGVCRHPFIEEQFIKKVTMTVCCICAHEFDRSRGK